MNHFRLAICLLLGFATAGCSARPGAVVATEGSTTSAVGYMADIRKAAGLAETVPDARLEQAAARQARLMAQSRRMAHTTGWGKDFSSRMKDDEIGGRASENIAHGRIPMNKVFAMWQASPPHRRNMLDPKIKRFGLASATAADGDRYWALVMAD